MLAIFKSCFSISYYFNYFSSKVKDIWDRYHNRINPYEVIEALQSEMVVSSLKTPIVATYGCSPCIAMGGYDTVNKIAFLIHFAHADEVKTALPLLLSKLKKTEKTIEIHLRGGIKGVSEKTYEEIKKLIEVSSISMKIVSEDILSNKGSYGKSLMIDSRTGRVRNYKANHHSRTFSENSILTYLQNLNVRSISLYEGLPIP